MKPNNAVKPSQAKGGNKIAAATKGKGPKNTSDMDLANQASPNTKDVASSAGVTPMAKTATLDTTKDVVVATEPMVAGGLGYSYARYSHMEPLEYRPQLLIRVIRLNPYGYTGSIPATQLALTRGAGRISQFFSELPNDILDKILKRDGIRFLPESFDNDNLIEWIVLLKCALRMKLRAIRTLIDIQNWNEATRVWRPAFARKNRRCSEAENVLSTKECPSLWTLLSETEPVRAPYAGGCLLVTIPDLSDIASHFLDIGSTHPAFINYGTSTYEDQWTFLNSSSNIDAMLTEIENGIKILEYRADFVGIDGAASDAAWLTGVGRGIKKDVQYLHVAMTELRYPTMGIASGDVLIDPAEFHHKLFGEAIYGVDLEDSTPDVEHPVGYPVINDTTTHVYRRGFMPMSRFNESGLDEVWATCINANREAVAWLGFKQVLGVGGSAPIPCKYKIDEVTRYGVGTVAPTLVNFDDADTLRGFFGLVASDHQWNQGLFYRQDSILPIEQDDAAGYAIHQGINIPFEGLYSAITSAFNVKFER